uniref:Uncharacterized protein n=1 Tax=Amphimedon queenslandica TaxID=400682 RepID=A0A1X7U3U0_AMPQE
MSCYSDSHRNYKDCISVEDQIIFLCAKVLQIVLLTASIVCLAVTTAVVSAGWAMTCNTYDELREDSPSFQLFSCTGYQYHKAPPHGGEIIAAAIFAGLTIPFLAVAIILFAARNRLETVRRHYQYTLQQQEPMDVIDTADPTAEDQ